MTTPLIPIDKIQDALFANNERQKIAANIAELREQETITLTASDESLWVDFDLTGDHGKAIAAVQLRQIPWSMIALSNLPNRRLNREFDLFKKLQAGTVSGPARF